MKIQQLLIFLLLIPLFSFQLKEDDCMAFLKEVFKKVSISEMPASGKAYYIEYEVKTSLKDKSISPSVSKVNLWMGSDQMQVVSSQMELYQDKSNAYTVIPFRKTIYLAESTYGKEIGKDQDWNVLKSKVLENSTLDYCKSTSTDGSYDREISITPSENVRKLFRITNVRFLINSTNKNIYKAILFYGPSEKIESVEVLFHQVNLDYKGPVLNTQLKNKFFNTDGSLKAPYKEYSLVDVRNNK